MELARPFFILALTLLVVLGAVVYALWRHPKSDDDLSTVDKLRELIRSVLIVTLTAAFVILSLEGKIGPDIYAQTFGIIIAFLFGQRNGERKALANGTTTPAPTP